MQLYSENKDYKLYQGNILDMLNVIETNSVDRIVTDPPYELNFMGKGWDNSGIAFQPDTWKKCYEALKPGGYLLAFGGSRTFHRIACAIEDAGFEIRDTIMWLYGSGFPKSMDISKQIDKRGAVSTSWFGEYLKNTLKERNMTQSDLAKHFPSKTGGLTGCVHNWIEGKNMPTIEQFNKICEILDLPFDKLEEAEREVIGQHNFGSSSIFGSDTYNKRDNGKVIDITIPSTDLAKQWQGWGTALKPSYEPIIVARKPFKSSLVDNVIEYGVGGINIDECRVESNGEKLTRDLYDNPSWKNSSKAGQGSINDIADKLGRFPANTILTYDDTDYEEVCGGFPNNTASYRKGNRDSRKAMFDFGSQDKTNQGYTDSGSASRYFYCAKASKKDRDEGLDNQEEIKVNDGRNTPIDNPFQRGETPRRNSHPTVKPTELMQYLVRLVTPNGGTVLDPFNGSGSTGKAVMYENKEKNKDYKYIGIELTEEYLPIAKARIEYVCNLIEEQEKQITVFDYI